MILHLPDDIDRSQALAIAGAAAADVNAIVTLHGSLLNITPPQTANEYDTHRIQRHVRRALFYSGVDV